MRDRGATVTVRSMDPYLVQITETNGVWLRREAKDAGYHEQTIEDLIKAGDWRRVRWGAFTYREIWEALTDSQRYALLCRAAYRRAQTEVAMSHRSGANEWATPLWDVALDEVDLTRKDGRSGRRAAGITQHRGKVLEGDWQEVNGVFVMSPTRVALELTTKLDVEHSLAEIDDLLHRGLTTPEQLKSRYAVMNHWPDTLHTDLVLRLADGRSESVGETRCRYLCWAQHLPAPEVNYVIRDRAGRELYRVDLAWPALGVFLEFDGKEKYTRFRRPDETIQDCVERERRRETHIIELTGWRVIRLVWADLYRPAHTANRIRALFRNEAA